MKITALVLISALLLFSTFVQNSDGFGGALPPMGERELQRKVCTSGINRQNKNKKRTKIKELHWNCIKNSVCFCVDAFAEKEKSSINTSQLCIMSVMISCFKGIENSTPKNE